MTFIEFVEETRKLFTDRLASYLKANGLASVIVLPSGIKLHDKPRSIAIYPTSSSGSTFSHNEQTSSVRLSVEFFCNENATDKGSVEAEKYYSALIGFIEEHKIGENHVIADSVLCRMDEGWNCNGCIFLIDSTISTQTDFGWD